MKRGIEILEGALAIGRQADPLTPNTVRTRMEAVKDGAMTASSVPDSPLFAKVKAWAAKKVLEPAN